METGAQFRASNLAQHLSGPAPQATRKALPTHCDHWRDETRRFFRLGSKLPMSFFKKAAARFRQVHATAWRCAGSPKVTSPTKSVHTCICQTNASSTLR